MGKACLCIDVGGTSIKYALIDETLTLSAYGKVKTPYDGVETYLRCLTSIYQNFKGQVDGVGMAVPGVIDLEGRCVSAGNLRFAEGLPLAEELSRRCGVPVTVMNDAKCAALAEAKWGALSDCKDGVVIVLGTGIGGAIIKDGNVHMGANYSAGEFSFITLGNDDPDGPFQMWSEVNGNPTLLHMASRAKNVPETEISGEDIFRWVEEGDQAVCQMMERFTATIARMIYNLQMIYDPERFAIGGGISRQPKLLEYIQKNLNDYYQRFGSGMPKAQVTTCQYFNEANLLGAYANFWAKR